MLQVFITNSKFIDPPLILVLLDRDPLKSIVELDSSIRRETNITCESCNEIHTVY